MQTHSEMLVYESLIFSYTLTSEVSLKLSSKQWQCMWECSISPMSLLNLSMKLSPWWKCLIN